MTDIYDHLPLELRPSVLVRQQGVQHYIDIDIDDDAIEYKTETESTSFDDSDAGDDTDADEEYASSDEYDEEKENFENIYANKTNDDDDECEYAYEEPVDDEYSL